MGQRNIPFRGHNWDKVTKREDGNFDFLVHWKAEDKPVLKQHLASAAYNAKYLVPTSKTKLLISLEKRYWKSFCLKLDLPSGFLSWQMNVPMWPI
jgi:hypothetical protein